jgi:translation initiation factor IF-1
LAKEWNFEKNGNLTPDKVVAGSRKRVWWKCKKGHEWQTGITKRNSGSGCPVCSSDRQQVKKYGVLSDENPELAKQWNFAKNIGLTPDEVTAGSGKKVWWVCKNGHEWEAGIAARNKGAGCPVCSSDRQQVKKYGILSDENPELAKQWNFAKNIGLTPDEVTAGSGKKVWWVCKNGHEWEAGIAARNKGAGCPICSNKRLLKGYNDLATMNPELAKEWHPTKNGKLTPDCVMPNGNKKVWWICKNGHEWEAQIVDRNRGAGCPVCANKQLLKGYNDLVTANPELAKEWHPTKNGKLTPDCVMPNGNKKVWWKCKKGHEWQTRIANRNRGDGCPKCANERFLMKSKSLAIVNPELAKEWHPTKNGELTPDLVTPNSHQKVWWICANGHEWEAVIANRNRGRGCPVCYRNKSQNR